MVNLISKDCGNRDYSLTQKSLTRLRVFTVMALTGFPIFSLTGMLDILDQLSKPVEFVITLALLLSFIPLTGDRIYNRLSRHKGKLDERERTAMQEARVFSYKTVFGLLLLSVIVGLSYIGLSEANLKAVSISPAWILISIMNLLFLMLFLPITYIAWTAKPLPDED